jgi:hypothetical protein
MVYPKLQTIIEVLKHIDNSENSKLGFDMNREYTARTKTEHPCGSACCIGGHAAAILGDGAWDIVESLCQLCDIPHHISNQLCWPGFTHFEDYRDISLDMAIKVLEYCRDYGVVDWGLE